MPLVAPLPADHSDEVARDRDVLPVDARLCAEQRPHDATPARDRQGVHAPQPRRHGERRPRDERAEASHRASRERQRGLPLLRGAHGAGGEAFRRQRRTPRRALELPRSARCSATPRRRRSSSPSPHRAFPTRSTSRSLPSCIVTGATTRSSRSSAWSRSSGSSIDGTTRWRRRWKRPPSTSERHIWQVAAGASASTPDARGMRALRQLSVALFRQAYAESEVLAFRSRS